jgi:hypothetical protein
METDMWDQTVSGTRKGEARMWDRPTGPRRCWARLARADWAKTPRWAYYAADRPTKPRRRAGRFYQVSKLFSFSFFICLFNKRFQIKVSNQNKIKKNKTTTQNKINAAA